MLVFAFDCVCVLTAQEEFDKPYASELHIRNS